MDREDKPVEAGDAMIHMDQAPSPHTGPGASGAAAASRGERTEGTGGRKRAHTHRVFAAAAWARATWQRRSGQWRRRAGSTARVARAWVGTRWERSADGLQQSHPRYAMARRWSPLVAPVLLWVALLALAVLLASHPVGLIHVSWRRVEALGGVLLLLGIALAIVLLDARDDTVWTAALGMGVFVYLAASVLVLFGLRAGLIATVLLAVCAVVFVRQRMHTVMDGTVHVTALYGRSHRALMPGRNVLLPGERVLAILDTQPREHTTMPQRARRTDGVVAGAAATVHYRLVPEMAELAVVAARDWEPSLRRLAHAVLLEELERWLSPEWDEYEDDPLGAASVQSHGAPGNFVTPEEQVRERVERRLRSEALRYGVEIEWVRLRAATLPPREPHEMPAEVPESTQVIEGSLVPTLRSSPMPPANPWVPPIPVGPALGGESSDQTQVLPTTQPPPAPSLSPTMPLQESEQQVREPDPRSPDRPRWLGRLGMVTRRLPVFHRQQTQPPAPDEDATAQPAEQQPDPAPAPAPAPRTLSPSMLASMFEAVYEQRISDPATVRQIASGFEQLAAGDDPDAGLPFDPEEAARTLHKRAEELAAQRGLEDEPGDSQPGHSSPRAFPVRSIPAQEPRDENVLRGG